MRQAGRTAAPAFMLVAAIAAGCGGGLAPGPSPLADPGLTQPPAAAGAGTTGGATGGPMPTTTARYVATFEATWSRATHPTDFPASAHFSALVGGTHDGSVSFWADGQRASNGIRDMAERGRTSPLDQEVAAAVSAGRAGQVIIGGAVGTSPGSATAEFSVTPLFPLVTLVSMVAPSPDWFIGVAGLSLAENGQWADERRVDLVPWDAGTDSGATFTSDDRVTSPPVGIFRIVTAPLSPGGQVRPLGTFVFRRVG